MLSLHLQNERFIILRKYLLRWEFLGQDLVEWPNVDQSGDIWWENGLELDTKDQTTLKKCCWVWSHVTRLARGQQSVLSPDMRDGLPAHCDLWSAVNPANELNQSGWSWTTCSLWRNLWVSWPYFKSPSSPACEGDVYLGSRSKFTQNVFISLISPLSWLHG